MFNYDFITEQKVDIIAKYLLNEKTLLVFDEIHKLKSITGVRANNIIKLLENTSNKPICLPNPIDTENFRVITPINERNPHTLGMLYHEGEHKGIPYALEAIDIVKKKYNDVVVNIFGVPNRPATLPDYFKYIQNANQKDLLKLYNETSIFVCATIDEGFGLTGAESMACGCALVSTAYDGVFEYAENGVNALLSPVRDSEALAENIIKLIENESCRQSLAQKASEMIRERSWDKTIQKLEIVLARELGVNRG